MTTVIRKASNNAETTLAAGGLAAAATTMTVASGDGGLFRNISSTKNEFEILTISESGIGSEIVKVTDHDAGGASPDLFTIEREQENTVARTFTAAANVRALMTAGGLEQSLFIAQSGAQAFRDINHTAPNSNVTYTAVEYGTDGDNITVQHIDPAAPSVPLSVAVVTSVNIQVTLETNGSSVIVTTANELIDAVNNNFAANSLVNVKNNSPSDGTGLVNAVAQTNLQLGQGPGLETIDIRNVESGSSSGPWGDQSITIGNETWSQQPGSLVIGHDATDQSTGTGGRNVIIGQQSLATGLNIFGAIAIGDNARVTQEGTIAIGDGAQAERNFGISIGSGILNVGTSSIIIGHDGDGDLNASDAIGMGHNVDMNGDGSVVLGFGAFSGPNGTMKQVVIGQDASSQSTDAICIGRDSSSNFKSVAIGAAADVGNEGVAIGQEADSSAGSNTIAIGSFAKPEAAEMVHIRGPIFIKKDDTRTDVLLNYVGAEATILSNIYDLTLATPFAGSAFLDVFTTPTGVLFYPTEVGVITVAQTAVTVNPAFSFGHGTTGTQILNNQTFANLGQAGGFGFFNALTRLGVATLSVNVDTAATATALTGRFYWKGVFIGA